MGELKEIQKELLIDSAEYLGENSYFTDVSGSNKDPVLDAARTQVANVMNSTQLKVGSNKYHFDLTTPDSAVGGYIRSPSFNNSKLKRSPIAFKALVCSRSEAANNEILSTEGDILQNPDTKVATEMIFQATQKLEVLSGYHKDQNGDDILSAPIWSEMDSKLLPTLGGAVCRMTYAEIPELGISPAEAFKLPYLDRVFVVGDNPLTVNISKLPYFGDPGSDINLKTKSELSENIKYATTNVVAQNVNKDPFRSSSLAVVSTQTTRAVVNTQTTRGGY